MTDDHRARAAAIHMRCDPPFLRTADSELSV